jgi:hypothetical protein
MKDVTWLQEHSDLPNTVTHMYCRNYESVEIYLHTLSTCDDYAEATLYWLYATESYLKSNNSEFIKNSRFLRKPRL